MVLELGPIASLAFLLLLQHLVNSAVRQHQLVSVECGRVVVVARGLQRITLLSLAELIKQGLSVSDDCESVSYFVLAGYNRKLGVQLEDVAHPLEGVAVKEVQKAIILLVWICQEPLDLVIHFAEKPAKLVVKHLLLWEYVVVQHAVHLLLAACVSEVHKSP